MKRQTIFLCVALMLATMLPMSAAAFSDIRDDEVRVAAETLAALDIVTGFEDGSFRPTSTLTRAQFAKMGVLSMGNEDKVALYHNYTLFPDVKTGHWAVGYVNVAVRESKLLSGYPDGTFRPDNAITEAEAVTICLRMLGYEETDIGSFWPNDYLVKAEEIGLTDGLSISPYAPMTRGRAAQLLANLLITETKEGSVFSLNMGLTGTENAVLLATEKTDLSLAQSIISVSVGGTVTQMSTVNDMPSSLVGMRGVLLTGKDGRVCGFVAGRYEPVSVVVKSRDADGINTTEGGRILVPAGTEVVLRGTVQTYQSAYVDLKAGTTLQLFYDKNGALSYLSTTASGVTGSENYVLEKGYTASKNPLLEYYGAAIVEQTPIYKNGVQVDASALKANDVVTYSQSLGRFLVSDMRLSGVINAAYPTKTRAQSFEMFGITFSLSDNKELDLSGFDGKVVTALIAPDGTVAGVVNSSSASALMGGVVKEVSGSTATVSLWSGYEISGDTTRDFSSLADRYVEVSVSYDGKLSLSEPSYSSLGTSDFSVAKMTLGGKAVAADVALYECADPLASFEEISLEDAYGTTGIVEAKKILYYKTDASGVVRAIVMRNATGNAFIYGLVSATEDDDGENRSYSVTTDTTAGSGVVTVSTVTAQGGVSLPVQGPYGGLAVGGGYARAFNKLEKQGQVTLDAFDAASNVHVDGRSLPISDEVQVYNESTKKFITLQQAKEDFNRFDIYTDVTAGIVRFVVVK